MSKTTFLKIGPADEHESVFNGENGSDIYCYFTIISDAIDEFEVSFNETQFEINEYGYPWDFMEPLTDEQKQFIEDNKKEIFRQLEQYYGRKRPIKESLIGSTDLMTVMKFLASKDFNSFESYENEQQAKMFSKYMHENYQYDEYHRFDKYDLEDGYEHCFNIDYKKCLNENKEAYQNKIQESILNERFGTDSWHASDINEDGNAVPNAEDKKYNRQLRKRMLRYAEKVVAPYWKLLKDIIPNSHIEENGYNKDEAAARGYDAYGEEVGEFWVSWDMFGGWDMWMKKAAEIIEANKDTLGYKNLEIRHYRNSDNICDITVEYDDKPGILIYRYSDGFHGIAIDVIDETSGYIDAYFGIDPETGKRNTKMGVGGYSKEISDYSLFTSKFIVEFNFNEDPSLNYKSKPLNAVKAVEEYYRILNENPAYKDAISQGTLNIEIVQQFSWRRVSVSKLEALIEKFGKTKQTWQKRRPKEPARWKYIDDDNHLNEIDERTDKLHEAATTKYMACCYDPEDYYEETNYIDEDGELKCNSSSAKLFDTEDEAIEYADDNRPYGWVSFAMPCNTMLDEATIPQAFRYARRKHGDTRAVRKATGAPYIVHPEGVAKIVQEYGGDDEQIQAAWLHDTVEDTGTIVEDLKEKFGDRVASLVEELTNDKQTMKQMGGKEPYMSFKLEHISDDALLIKLSDFLYNLKDFCSNDTLRRMLNNLKHLNFCGRNLDSKCSKLLDDALSFAYREMKERGLDY